MINGWLAADGITEERIYDVAVSDQWSIGADGRCRTLGNTVDIEQPTYTNAIGAIFLQTFWRDPGLDPRQGAY